MKKLLASFTLVTLLGNIAALHAATIDADICIFGGTSAGVIAAVQASKMGKKVVLVEPGAHLGGLTSGGLGWTDTGNKEAIGGLSREFYQRLGTHYAKKEAWTFEPSVAEHEFNALVAEAKVPVHLHERLASVKKDGTRIVEITTENGDVFRAGIFIDTTYEGDLMAKAGVSYFVGREGNATYNETLNGVREKTPQHQFIVPVDPYVKPGDPASGLLPFIQSGKFGDAGTGDKCIQAFNFRLCLTKNPDNKKPIDPPAGYDPAKYELLGRYLDALVASGKKITIKNFLKIDMVTPEKTDINNNGGFSTDYIGMNYSYADATYADRERMQAEHLDYIRGLLTYLATSPRVPADIRAVMQEWGLCKDEFTDSGGWPFQLYVREARRMLSDYIMTEKNCRRIKTVPDSVGLGAYNMDSHNCRRLVRDGHVQNEGDVQSPSRGPYSIAYRSIVPKAAECTNLLVPVCLASSHIAYGSIRMEPVFMILGQSAATAASMAIDDKVPVQKVDYQKLSTRLLADNQILIWTKPPPPLKTPAPAAPDETAKPPAPTPQETTKPPAQ